jgi:hypothetical protein
MLLTPAVVVFMGRTIHIALYWAALRLLFNKLIAVLQRAALFH